MNTTATLRTPVATHGDTRVEVVRAFLPPAELAEWYRSLDAFVNASAGEGFGLQKFPLGTRVIYPPDSLPAVKDVTEAIRDALLNPVGSDPLPELLKPGMRLTIAFDAVPA